MNAPKLFYNHSCMEVASILNRLFYTHIQIQTDYIMDKLKVSHSCMGILSRLFYTHLQTLTNIMGKFRVRHSCKGVVMFLSCMVYIPHCNSALIRAMISGNHISFFCSYLCNITLFMVHRVNLISMMSNGEECCGQQAVHIPQHLSLCVVAPEQGSAWHQTYTGPMHAQDGGWPEG